MSVNPFQVMRARYFLIVFALLILIARSSGDLLTSIFHIQNSSFINILIFYILPMVWISYEYRKHHISFSLFVNKMKHLTWYKFYTLRLCYACLVTGILFCICIVLHGLHRTLL